MFANALNPAGARVDAGRRRLPAGRQRSQRARPPRPAEAPVREPHWAEVPDWSEATLEKLTVLTPLEQAVVVWRVCGYSGAEAYRRATGRDSHSARQSANQILRRPKVAAAVEAGLKDRNFAGRIDLEWYLAKLHWAVVACQEARTPAHVNALCNAIKLMARLQGEWPGSRRWSSRRPAPPPQPVPSPGFERLVRQMEELVSRPHPRPAVVGPPAAAPSATPSSAYAPPAVGNPAMAPAADLRPTGPVRAVAARSDLAADGRSIGEVRPFRGMRPPAVEPPGPAATGPVPPRVPREPKRSRGSMPYFMGCWA
jgi:hypothetical protein